MNETGSSSESSTPNSSKEDRIVLSDGRVIKSGKKNSRDTASAAERLARKAAEKERFAAKKAKIAEEQKAKDEARARKKEAKEAEKARFAAKKAKIEEEQKAKDEARLKAKEAKKAAREEKARKAAEAKEAEKARMAAKKARIEEEQKAKDEARAKKKEEKKAARMAALSRPDKTADPETAEAEVPTTENATAEVPEGEAPASQEAAATPELPRHKVAPGTIVLQDGRELKSGKLKSSSRPLTQKLGSGKKKKLTAEERRERLKHLNPTGVAIRIAMLLVAFIIVFVVASSYSTSTTPLDETGSGDMTETGMEESEAETTKVPMIETPQAIKGQLQTTEIATETPDAYAGTKTPAWAKGRWVPFSMVFTGDFNPSELLSVYDEKGIYGIIDRDLRSEMKTAALTMVNQEFAFGTGGVKLSDKQNTYRVDTQYLPMFESLGIRLMSLANDHTLDYGRDLLSQTFQNLEGAGIDYVGAGANPDRASQWQSYQLGKVKVAVIAASRVLPTSDWNVENATPGIFSTYDASKINEQIAAAKAENDIVIVYAHWGIEKSSKIEEYQRELAHSYVEAGADLIIGSHPQVLQGIEYYKDVPIIYSLGSFMFHDTNDETAVLKVNVNRFKRMQLQLIPCAVTDSQTHKVTGDEAAAILQHVESLSINAKISKTGIISQN